MTQRSAFILDQNLIISTNWNGDFIDVDFLGDLYFAC